MRFRFILVLPFLLALLTFSCTRYKDVPYFQDLKRDSTISEPIANLAPLVIQKGDILAIHVSSLNHDADALINYKLERPSNSNLAASKPEEATVHGYLVDQSGNIQLAYLGAVKLDGYTLDQVTGILKEKLGVYLKNPVVTVRIQNFRVSILGDVKNPGVYYTQNSKISVLEAIGLAGDLNSTGLRKNVLLIRENNGERQYVNLDLTSKGLISSKFFYLKSGDVVYIQPSKEKVQASDSAFQKASILISALSLLAIFVTRYN